MKKKLFLFAAMLCMAGSSFATMHMITVADFSFSPATLPTVHLGDTIMWMWGGGTHTTTSTTIPTDATRWNSPINGTTSSFIYVPTVMGTYNYNCSIHPSSMVGSFVVVAATQVPTAMEPGFGLYPNPSAGQVHLVFGQGGDVSVTVADVTGKEILRLAYAGMQEADLDLSHVANGYYLIQVMEGNRTYRQQLVVTH